MSLSPLPALLADQFDYEHRMNALWNDALASWPDAAHPQDVLHHILRSQWLWLDRITRHLSLPHPVSTPFAEITIANQTALTEAWKTLVTTHDLNTRIAYTRDTGDAYQNNLLEIARHVLNHGTYHRGHLRGLADARRTDQFPETDLIIWLREETR